VVLSARPGRLAGILNVDLPRPRPAAAEAKTLPEFAARRRQVWELINLGSESVGSEGELQRVTTS